MGCGTCPLMATAPDHSAIINRAARAALKPLGLQQKGRSRFWYDDYGWRAYFVEFQPSSWSKGTYCNVGAMWLWELHNAGPHWVFHTSERIEVDGGEFLSFQNDPSRFEPSVIALAESAVHEVLRLRNRFSSVEAVAEHYTDQPAIGWPGFHGGIALGLIGSSEEARVRFRSVAGDASGSDIPWIAELGRTAESLSQLTDDLSAFHARIEERIATCRAGLRMRPLTPPVINSASAQR